MPKIEEQINPDRTTLILEMKSEQVNLDSNVDENSVKNSVKSLDLTVDDEIILKLKEKYPELKEKYIDIIRLIVSNKYITQEEIGKKLNKTKNAVYRNIKTLRDLDIIQRVNATNGGYWEILGKDELVMETKDGRK